MEITEAATAWMMNGFARKWDVNFLSSFGLLLNSLLFILNFIKKFSTLLRLAEKVVVQLRRGEKGKAQQDDDNAVSLSSLPPPQPPSLSLLWSWSHYSTAAAWAIRSQRTEKVEVTQKSSLVYIVHCISMRGYSGSSQENVATLIKTIGLGANTILGHTFSF